MIPPPGMPGTLNEQADSFVVYSGAATNVLTAIAPHLAGEQLRNAANIDILHAPYFVQEDVMLKRLLRDMQRDKVHMAVVLDEFGGTAGLLTLEDIIEELVGNIQDEYDDEEPLHTAASTADAIELDASIHIDQANEVLSEPLPESDDYETLGGMLNNYAGRIPSPGDVVQLEGYECTILSGTPRRAERVLLRRRK